MAVFRRGSVLLALLGSVVAGGAGARADSTPASCRYVTLDFTPGGISATDATRSSSGPEIDPQIVAWMETPDGKFVKTIFITQQTGKFGLGNRPGRFDFNSGPNWPYGRRMVFPVWSHRHGLSFPELDFQSGGESALSHMAGQSSRELHYCRPLGHDEAAWDAATCASAAYTDKGVMGTSSSLYPPRNDVDPTPGIDSPSVQMYRTMNPFDAISGATPKLGTQTSLVWPIDATMAMGSYVMFVEVALEQDFNTTSYTYGKYPSPDVAYGDYGVPYRGMPSVIYKVPFAIQDGEATASTDTYAGYGDPDGAATLHAPDATITSDVPGRGALRLMLTSKDGEMFRLRVRSAIEHDTVAPGAPSSMLVSNPQQTGAALTFVAPGDDGMVGKVQGYDVRYMQGDVEMTEANFTQASEVTFDGEIAAPGSPQSLTIKGLLPETEYTVAVRAYDNCGNPGPIATTTFMTAERRSGEVDACFVATAAYGSVLANDVEMLRRFRDTLLRHSILGELAVETYYTFGPPVAGVVGQSDLLLETARDALGPLVARIRGTRW